MLWRTSRRDDRVMGLLGGVSLVGDSSLGSRRVASGVLGGRGGMGRLEG